MSASNPDYQMEALDRWIARLAQTPGPLLSKAQFEDAHMKARLDNHLADLYENAWPSYNSLALATPKDTSTGMSAFDPKETAIPTSMEIDKEDNPEDDGSEAEEDEPFNPLDSYRPSDDLLPHSPKTTPAMNEATYHTLNQGALTRQMITASTNHLEGKIDSLTSMIKALGNTVATQNNIISNLLATVGRLHDQQANNNHNNNNHNYPNNQGKSEIKKSGPPPINDKSRPQHQNKQEQNNSYAGAAKKGAETPVQIATKKTRKPSPPPAFNTTRPAMEREILVTVAEPVPQTTMDNKILLSINESLGGQFRFMLAKATSKHTIILQTPTNSDSSAAMHYDNEIRSGLSKIGIMTTEIKVNSKMTRFIIDGVPTEIGSNLGAGCIALAGQLANNYPEIELAQISVWMCKPDTLATKAHASMIIAFKGTHTIDSLGRRSIVICNKFCRLRPYLIQTPTTQCHKCQKHGHHTDLCKDENPTCGHCSKNHLTKDHPCPECKGGFTCRHTPFRCVNCPGEPHASYDPNCKAKARIMNA